MLLHRWESYETDALGTLLHGDAADVRLVFLTPEILRIRVSFSRQFPEHSYTLVTTAWPDAFDSLLQAERRRIAPLAVPPAIGPDGRMQFDFPGGRLCVAREPFACTLYGPDGAVRYRDLPTRAYEQDWLGRVSHYSVFDEAHMHFYGFGEKNGPLDKRGRRMRMNPKDALGSDPENGDPLYKHIPFYLQVDDRSGEAVGLFYHNSYDCVFDMGQEISGYWPRYRYWQADGGDIDLFLLLGPTPADVLRQYTLLTGRSAMPRRQALGFSMTTMYYCELERDCDREIEQVVDAFAANGLPLDNFWLGSGYSAGEEDRLRYVFHWNRDRFPDPPGFVARMARRGLEVVPNLKPGLLARHPDLPNLLEQPRALVREPDGETPAVGRWWGGPGRFFDFTAPAGREAWKKLLKARILEKGIRGIWNDNCEYDGIEDRSAVCEADGLGGTMAEYKPLQSNLMGLAACEASQEVYPHERPYIISRAGYAGIQRYAQVWDGDNLTDWRSLRYNIQTIVGMGLSGVPNTGEDIGGFAGGAPDAELLLRWVQCGVFQPRFCMNSANNDNTVTQPWMYPELLPLLRQAFGLRYKLLPYLYTQLYLAHQDGTPVLRPLFWEFPQDADCYRDDSATFLFGPALLVANVVEPGAAARTLYLPAGCTWYDCNDNLRAYAGGQTITVPVGPGSIPMFLRGSGVLYTSPDLRKLATDTVHNLDLLVAAETDCTAVYYEDDGHSDRFEHGDYARTDITVQAGERTTLRFVRSGQADSALQQMTVALVSKRKGAMAVLLEGRPLPRFLLPDLFAKAEAGWYYDLRDRTVRVRFAVPSSRDFTLTISCEPFDLIGMTQE